MDNDSPESDTCWEKKFESTGSHYSWGIRLKLKIHITQANFNQNYKYFYWLVNGPGRFKRCNKTGGHNYCWTVPFRWALSTVQAPFIMLVVTSPVLLLLLFLATVTHSKGKKTVDFHRSRISVWRQLHLEFLRLISLKRFSHILSRFSQILKSELCLSWNRSWWV